jgi:N-methylhydantoinase B
LPPGRVGERDQTAPVRTWMTVPMTVADTIFKALAPACPDNVMAGQHADLAAPRTFRSRSKDRPGVSFPSILSGGGWGAQRSRRPDATFCINDGDTHNTPVEAGREGADFHRYRKLRQDPAARKIPRRAGRGSGRSLALARQRTIRHGAHDLRALGSARRQGRDAQPLQRLAQRRAMQKLPTGKTPGHIVLEAGDGFGGGRRRRRILQSVGARSAKVVADVRSGYVSLEAAQRDYGVAVNQRGRRSSST